jgi:hypothetical protein
MPAQQLPNSPAKAIPCIEAPIIVYHAPQDAPTAKIWLSGGLADPQNLFDTPSTVMAIRQFNAARNAVCN